MPGRSGTLLSLGLVTTVEHQKVINNGEGDDLTHGTVVSMMLIATWACSKRTVCADSYFASVTKAMQLLRMVLRCIGVVKTAIRRYPTGALSVPRSSAQHRSFLLLTADGVTDLMAVLWVACERQCFIFSASTTLPGDPCERVRWRQVETEAERMAFFVPFPQVAEVEYNCFSIIDRHNRCRQDDFQFEHKLATHDWSLTVNLFILGISVADSWLLCSGALGVAAALTQEQAYQDLGAQLIDNTFDTVGTPQAALDAEGREHGPLPVRYGDGVHLTPT